ncbi:MAG: hypothetical protein RIQ33_1899 [Bacteroidota bacterium]|jgi:PAS domain S-box-containing protein
MSITSTTTLSADLILLLNQTPQHINVAKYEGMDGNGIHTFRIIFLNTLSLQTPEAKQFIGKTAIEANPEFLNNGVYEILVDVFENGNAQTITYPIVFAGQRLIIEALIVKTGNYLISYSKDITASLTEKKILFEHNKLLQDAHKVLNMGTWELDMISGTISSNFSLSEFFENPLIGNSISLNEYYNLLFEDDIAEAKQNFANFIASNEPFMLERRFVSPSGKDKYLEITGKAFFENDECIKLVGTFRDISKQKYTEFELVKDEIILAEAKQLHTMCTWSFNPVTQKSVYSKELSEILEFEIPVELSSFDDYLSFIHPDDKDSVKQNFEQTIANNNYDFKADRKIITQKGNVKYIEIIGKSITKNGTVKRVFGTIRDITEEKTKLLGLFEQELRLKEIKRALKVGTWQYDFRKHQAHFSIEFSEVLEYEKPMVFNGFDEYLVHVAPEEKETAILNFNSLTHLPSIEIRVERKFISAKGNIKYVEITCNSESVDDKIVRIFGTTCDITERKLKDIKLLESKAELLEARSLLKMGSLKFNYQSKDFYISEELSKILEFDAPKEFHDFEDWHYYIAPEEKEISKTNFELGSLGIVTHAETVERKFISAKGNIKYIELIFEPNQFNEHHIITGTFRDITEKKIYDLQLLEKERELIEARKLLKMGSFYNDFSNGTQYYSKEMSEILEYNEPFEITDFEFVKKHYDEENKKIVENFFHKIKNPQINPNDTIRFVAVRKVISAKGNIKYIEFNADNIYQNNILIKGTGTFRDITDKKNEELKLQKAEKELIEARGLLKMGTWSFDIKNNVVYYSKELSEILQYETPIEFYDFDQFFAHVHADDKAAVKSNYLNVIKPDFLNIISTIDRKLVNYHGQICYVEFKAKAILENGIKVAVHGTYRDITEKKISDLKIQESEKRLLEAQQILKTGTWQYNIANHQLELSAEIANLLNQNLPQKLKAEEYFKYINPAVRQKFITKFNEQINQRLPFKAINNFLFKDGSEFFVEIVGQPISAHPSEIIYHGTFRDITEEYKKDAALKDSEERFRLVFEHNPSMYFTVDEQSIILSVNQFGIDYLGFDSNELVGQPITKLFYADDVTKAIRNIEILKLSHEKFWQWEIRKVKKNGSVIWVKETARMVKDKTGKNIFLIICEDISTDIENRELIKAKQAELLIAKERAEDAAKEKQQFSSIMSHEIRTPLNAVIGITNLLLMENPKPEQVTELNTLKFASENLLLLVNDILDFNKIESGKIELEKIPFNVSSLIKNIKNSYQYKANEKGIAFNSSIDEDLPDFVLGDPTRLSQILTNLISNAIKFTENGFVEIMLRKMKAIADDYIKIRFEISDTGIGIPKNKHAAIFESFSQASVDTNRKFGGTGLGLTITKKLIELHQSNIFLQSEVGKGTTFYFDIEFKITDQVANENIIKILSNDKKDLNGRKILVVEDNAFNQLVAVKFLEKWNVEVDVAENGLIALDKIKTHNYDLILMDIQMPEMNGIEATAAIRNMEDEQLKNIPIIAFTAAADSESEKLIAQGMNDCVSKPFNPTELFNKILQHI